MWIHRERDRFHYWRRRPFCVSTRPLVWGEDPWLSLCAKTPGIPLETVWFVRRAAISPACWLFSPEDSALSVLHPAGAGRGSQVEEAAGEWVASRRTGDGGHRGLFVGCAGITGTQLSVWGVRKQSDQHSEQGRILVWEMLLSSEPMRIKIRSRDREAIESKGVLLV